MATMTEAGRLTSVSDFKVIWCFVHVCVGVNKTFYKTFAFSLLNDSTIHQGPIRFQNQSKLCIENWSIFFLKSF